MSKQSQVGTDLATILEAAARARQSGLTPAVSYARVSTEHQLDGTSIRDQQVINRATATHNGGIVVAEFHDAVSGSFDEARKGLGEALKLVESGVTPMFVIAQIDRSGRDVDLIRRTYRRVVSAGGRFVKPEGEVHASAHGQVMLTMEAAFAEFNKHQFLDRTMQGKRGLASKGLAPSANTAPPGFRIITAADCAAGGWDKFFRGRYVVSDPDSIASAATAIRMWMSGSTLSDIGRWLHTEGSEFFRSRPARRSAVLDVVDNPVYAGVPMWGRFRYQTMEKEGRVIRKVTRQPLDNVVHLLPPLNPDGTEWTPIISMDEWMAIHERADASARLAGGRRGKVHMLTKVLSCPLCGHHMTAGSSKPKPCYICSKKGGNTGCCGRVSSEAVEELAIEGIIWAVMNHADITRCVELEEARHKRRSTTTDHSKRIEEIKSAERIKVGLISRLAGLGTDTGQIEKELADLVAERVKLEADRPEGTSQPSRKSVSLVDISKLLPDVLRYQLAEGLPQDEKRRLVASIIESAVPIKQNGKYERLRITLRKGIIRSDTVTGTKVQITVSKSTTGSFVAEHALCMAA